MAPDALHTIEAPPVGNCTFTQAFEAVNDNITLIGNIQYEDFRSFTKEQMIEAVTKVLDECKDKRLILSPSAGPFLEPLPKQMIDNYITFMAITVATVQTALNTYIGDTSTDSVSAAERLNAITEATIWLQQELAST